MLGVVLGSYAGTMTSLPLTLSSLNYSWSDMPICATVALIMG